MKLRPETLSKYVLSRIGVRDPSVIIGPSIGEDAAVIDLGNNKVLVLHSDPITGAIEHLGWLAVHIASNDVAVTGAKPRWLLPVLYLPEDISEDVIDIITSQMDLAAKELNAMIVGGHTEYTPGIKRPLVSMTALGIAKKDSIIRTGGARVGDVIIMTKSAGVEGTAILASDFNELLRNRGVKEEVLRSAREFIRNVSVVKEALALTQYVKPTSMHDPTEGGVLAGLAEMAYASGKTFIVYEDKVNIAYETKVISKALGIDPLKLISSGTLLATVPKVMIDRAFEVLENVGVKASIIGEVIQRKNSELVILKRSSGVVERYSDVYIEDELMKLWRLNA